MPNFPRIRFSRRAAVLVCVALAGLLACASEPEPDGPRASFIEHEKTGALSLMIVGDYFHSGYVLELAKIAQSLSPATRQIIVCTSRYRDALTPFLESNNVRNVEYVTVDESSFLLTQWARDILVAGRVGETPAIVVSANKHATSPQEASAFGTFLQGILPDHDVRVAPFVFEAGNLVFLEAEGRRILILGQKVLFDNTVYQRRPWADGFDSRSLLAAARRTFDVDTVLVAGLSIERPDTRRYFEYHIDMGMVVLSDDRAVVSELAFGPEARAALADAIEAEQPVVTPFLEEDGASPELFDELSRRLNEVSREYEGYATMLDSLGLEVHRSTVGWREVLGSMSWTNVVQMGDHVLMPIYPDTLRAETQSTTAVGGQITTSLDVSRIDQERFFHTGRNGENLELYEHLGYRVSGIPEYLHYMMGGVHCFVNIIE